MIPVPTRPTRRPLTQLLTVVGWLTVCGLPLRPADEVPVPATADHLESDFNSDQYHLWGNVDITIPGLARLQCDDFRGVLPASSSEAANAVMTATGNVRLQLVGRAKGTNAPFELLTFSDQAVYTGTNETFTLTGKPRVVSAYGTLSGLLIRYNIASNLASADQPRFVPNPTLLTNLLDRARSKSPDRGGK